jgi:uncharacterized protein (DUF58 family)
MQRAGAVLLLIIATFVGALLSDRERSQDILFNISYLFAFLLVVSYIWTWINIRTVRLTRITRARRAQVGRTMEERFQVHNTGFVPKLWLEVRDYSDLPGHLASHVVKGMRPKGRYEWRVNTLCARRGRFTLGPITMTSGDPFGLFQMQRKLTPTSHLVVYPMTVDIDRFALPIGILPGGEALRRRTHHVTANAAGVRDYAPGDSFNRIHWRSTARRGDLIVKEFELDPLADIWIAPDMYLGVQLVAESEETASIPGRVRGLWSPLRKFELEPSTEEYVVTVAASLAQHFLRRDRAVGMIAYADEREMVQPDRGERQLSKIMETLAVLRGTGEVPIDHLLNAEAEQIPRGTTLIIVSPSASEMTATAARQLERRGVRVIVVLIDPSSFGGRRSAVGVKALLQAAGTPAYLIRQGDALEEVLSQRMGPQHYYAVA